MGRWRCPYCESNEKPNDYQQVSGVGWALFWVLLLSMFGTILCWIPLVACKERVRRCYDCGTRIN